MRCGNIFSHSCLCLSVLFELLIFESLDLEKFGKWARLCNVQVKVEYQGHGVKFKVKVRQV